MLSVRDINRYLTGIFMYQCIHKEAPEFFKIYFIQIVIFIIMILATRRTPMFLMGELMSDNSAQKYIEQNCGIPYQIRLKMPSLYTCSSNNFATIWLNHASSVITISSMWIMFILNMTVPIDESCIVLVSCWSVVSISSDIETQWNPGESINRLTMLKCTFLLTPVLLLITLVNEEVITYLP